MKSIAILFGVLCLVTTAHAVEIEPLASRDSVVSGAWANEPTELAYVTSRCDVLMTATSLYFKENGRTPKDQEIAKDMLGKAQSFRLLSLLTFKEAGLSVDSMTARTKLFFETYGERMKANKIANNNAFDAFILGDMNFCNQALTSIKEFAQSQQIEQKPRK